MTERKKDNMDSNKFSIVPHWIGVCTIILYQNWYTLNIHLLFGRWFFFHHCHCIFNRLWWAVREREEKAFFAFQPLFLAPNNCFGTRSKQVSDFCVWSARAWRVSNKIDFALLAICQPRLNSVLGGGRKRSKTFVIVLIVKDRTQVRQNIRVRVQFG